MKKSKAMAIASFVFSLTFWIPLLNMIFGALALIVGIKALLNIKKQPQNYSGKWYAIAGITIAGLVYITYFTGLGICLYGNKEVCKGMGITFLG